MAAVGRSRPSRIVHHSVQSVLSWISMMLECYVEFLQEGEMKKFARTLFLTLLMPVMAVAGPVKDAYGVVDHWSAAFNANDPEAVVGNYWPDGSPLSPPESAVSTSGSDQTTGRSAGEIHPSASAPTSAPSDSPCSGSEVSSATLL